MKKHLFLLGMMGAGKTRWGQLLAAYAGVAFIDADIWLEEQTGITIAQWFAGYGEDAFRDAETRALQQLLTLPPAIIATGGGVVLRPENRQLLATGTRWYLRYGAEDLIRHLSESKKVRPLLQSDHWQEAVRQRLQEREPLYQEADVIIDLSGLTDEGKWQRLTEEWKQFVC